MSAHAAVDIGAVLASLLCLWTLPARAQADECRVVGPLPSLEAEDDLAIVACRNI